MERLNEIINGKRGVTADTALRLARYFGNSQEFWLNLQIAHDLRAAERKVAERIEPERYRRGRLHDVAATSIAGGHRGIVVGLGLIMCATARTTIKRSPYRFY